nr:MAG TPA: terminase small subunit [Caudoviricetes sp.]
MAGGRPSEFNRIWNNEDGLLRIAGWARDGLTNEQIAENMGIGLSTLYEWQKRYTEFADALKTNKEIVDRHVENALLKRALGYEHVECTYEADEETGEMRITKRITKQVVPDTTAQIFWLKNRKPEDWRDKQQIEHSGEVNIAQTLKAAQERAKT